MGMDLQGKLRLALGSVKDHASIGKAMIHNHHDGFSDIEIAVLRATGHDNGPIDDKHMHEILFLVSNSSGSMSFLAERISRRLGKTRDRLVALKTLILIHRLLRGGNRCFEQQFRGAHFSGHLQMGTRRFSRINANPSVSFLHKYSSYLEERMGWVINQAGKLELAVSQGLELRCYEEKAIDMVFRKLPKCQVFIDKVLDCSPFYILPSDNLAQFAMINVLKESFQVYMTLCEGIAALVNMFFDLTRPARGLACEILRRASQQTQGLHDLYENCKKIIENKNLEYPSVQIITMDHIMALEKCSSCAEDHHQLISCAKASVLSRTTEFQVATTTMEGKKKEQKSDIGLSSTLFSWSLETKISKVWVVFEDEDRIQSGEPDERLFHGAICDVSVQQNNSGNEHSKPCAILNPFTTCVGTSIVSKV